MHYQYDATTPSSVRRSSCGHLSRVRPLLTDRYSIIIQHSDLHRRIAGCCCFDGCQILSVSVNQSRYQTVLVDKLCLSPYDCKSYIAGWYSYISIWTSIYRTV